MELIHIGTIVNPKGLEGAFVVGGAPGFAGKIPIGTNVLVGYSANFAKEFRLKKWKRSGKQAVAAIEGIDSPEDAAKLKELGIFIDKSALRKSNNSAMAAGDIIGCCALDYEGGKPLGEIVEIWEIPAGDILVIERNGEMIPVPYVDEFVKKVDLEKREVLINVIPGLLELGMSHGEEDE